MQLGNLSSGQKDELMDQVKQQIAVANVQELLTVIQCCRKPNPIIFIQNFFFFPNFFTENDIQML